MPTQIFGYARPYRTMLLLKQIRPGGKEAIPALSTWLNLNQSIYEKFLLQAANEALRAVTGSQEAK